jgi:hypothetical protein
MLRKISPSRSRDAVDLQAFSVLASLAALHVDLVGVERTQDLSGADDAAATLAGWDVFDAAERNGV